MVFLEALLKFNLVDLAWFVYACFGLVEAADENRVVVAIIVNKRARK